VLVTKLSFGDNAPLRPGYRKDFGYNFGLGSGHAKYMI
jgi:hypothetical protein